LPIGTQARLLRVLETGEYIRVGSSKVQKTNVRVIAATNKDLLALVNAGRFREDLYYRLSTVPIRVASLRERKEDIPVLFRKFCVDFADRYKTTPIQLTDEAKEILVNYHWPGNIRELKNIAEQISVLAPNKLVQPHELEFFLPSHSTELLPAITPNLDTSSQQDFNSERDILYKLFFDMKKDVNELKKMVFEIVKNPMLASQFHQEDILTPEQYMPLSSEMPIPQGTNKPIIITNNETSKTEIYHSIEENLNLAEIEKEIIIKALKKHRKRRRDAASELGISERTLYRKIRRI
jgi:transcriptional regulator